LNIIDVLVAEFRDSISPNILETITKSWEEADIHKAVTVASGLLKFPEHGKISNFLFDILEDVHFTGVATSAQLPEVPEQGKVFNFFCHLDVTWGSNSLGQLILDPIELPASFVTFI
jgi:hypothetical protein